MSSQIGRLSALTPEFVPQSVRNQQRRNNTMKRALSIASLHQPTLLPKLIPIIAPDGMNENLEGAYAQTEEAYASILGKRNSIFAYSNPPKQIQEEDVQHLVHQVCVRRLIPPPMILRRIILQLSRHRYYEAIQAIIHCIPDTKSYIDELVNGGTFAILPMLVKNSLYYFTSDKSIPLTQPIVPREIQLDCIQTILNKANAKGITIHGITKHHSYFMKGYEDATNMAIEQLDVDICAILFTNPKNIPNTAHSLWKGISSIIDKSHYLYRRRQQSRELDTYFHNLDQILQLLVSLGFNINMLEKFPSHDVPFNDDNLTLLEHINTIPQPWMFSRMDTPRLQQVKTLLQTYGAKALRSHTVGGGKRGGKRTRSVRRGKRTHTRRVIR
jgi:hypothetical protein